MAPEAWITLVVLGAMVVALARDWLHPALAVLGANIVLLILGVITTAEALSGFSNPAPITVAALFVLARAVEKTGALQPLIEASMGRGPDGRRHLIRLLGPTAAFSAVLNNTPIVAMLAPRVADWAQKTGQSPSRFLMPLSFAAILGGTITAIGTSTNLVVSGLLEESGMAPLGMFELARVGVPVALLGLGIIVLLAPVVLPDRRPARSQFSEEMREYVMHQEVLPGGALDGQTVAAAGLRHLEGVFLAEIEREGETIAPATPATVLRGGDRLAFVGRVDMVRDLTSMRGLASSERHHAASFQGPEHTFFEIVLSPASSLVGKTLREAEFRSRFQAAVLAIHRAGERVNAKLGDVRLKGGDTLLVLSDHAFGRRWRDHNEFLLVSHLGGNPPASTHQAWFVGAVALGIVLLGGLGIFPILHAALLGAVALVVGKALSPAEARAAIELDTLVVIAAAFGLGAALQTSGLAALTADLLVGGFSGFGGIGVLLAVTLATIALTELITNNAAAVLVFPIALASAAQVGADPRGYAIAVAIGASASFLTPIGYQTNTMVYGPGGYRFGDYARLGAPLTLIVILTILLVVPLFWPF